MTPSLRVSRYKECTAELRAIDLSSPSELHADHRNCQSLDEHTFAAPLYPPTTPRTDHSSIGAAYILREWISHSSQKHLDGTEHWSKTSVLKA